MSGDAVPLKVARPGDARLIVALLRDAGFSEAEIVRRLRVLSLNEYDATEFRWLGELLSNDDAFRTYARLFLLSECVDVAHVRAAAGEAGLAALERTDLVRPECAGEHAGSLSATVRLVPVGSSVGAGQDVFIASDRPASPDGEPIPPPPDVVFSGHNPLTRQFLSLLPRGRFGGDVLDLCSGTGVAAILLDQRTSGRTVATDLASRSVHFARFNAWLNGSQRVEVAEGDLYAPVAGRTFDCVVAHPPYVPTLRPTCLYRDGGQLGDRIVRALLERLPAHLGPGGSFVMLCIGLDTADGCFEQRVRAWLGEAGQEFDIVFALDHGKEPDEFARYISARTSDTIADVARWRDLFERHAVREVVYGALVMRRIAGRRAEVRRVKLRGTSTFADFEWLLRWFDWRRDKADADILSVRPVAAADVELEVHHVLRGGQFVPDWFRLGGGHPFPTQVETEAWVVALLQDFTGRRTVREVVDAARASGRVPSAFGDADAVHLVSYLAERGLVTFDREVA